MNITHISVSRKGVWDECKKKYWYKYHEKVESPEEEPFYFVYGKIVHKIAEEYVRERGKKTVIEVKNAVLGGEIPFESYQGELEFAPPLPLAYKNRLGGHLTSIAKITEDLGWDGELEYSFKYDLDPPNERFVVGFIDRLIKKGDQYWILDYKTTKKGKYRKTKKNIQQDIQLRAYARVVQKEFDVPADKIRAALYYLEGGNLLGARFTDRQLLATEKELLFAHEDIEGFPPEKAWGNIGEHCRRCDHRSLCPFYRKSGF